MTARSYLYVPATSADRLAKAGSRGADAVIFDLEDSVPAEGKDAARALLASLLPGLGPASGVWVRVDSASLDRDIPAVVGAVLAGIVVPKATPALLDAADAQLAAAERARGLPVGSVRVVALLESAYGVLHAEEVAAAPRVDRLGVGEADLVGELGLQPGPDRAELAGIRLQVVLASAAAGIEPPIGPVDTSTTDLDALRTSTQGLLRQGFRARTAVHPRQLPVINKVFTPSAAEVARAREMVAGLEEARSRGSGVAVDSDGRILDAAVVRAARDVLARAR